MAKNSTLELIFPIYNILSHRGHERVLYSLESLERQTNKKFTVLIVDGSTENEYRQLKTYTDRYPFVKHFYYPIDELNISLLHNVGIKESEAEYIMRTDCDYVFAKDFIESVRNNMRKNRLVLKQVGILPNMNITMSRIRMWNFPKVHLWEKLGDGACQLTTREWFLKVNGYDERMVQYGVMDNDLNVRAQKDGVKIHWMEESSILHLWHRITWDKDQAKRDQFATNVHYQCNNPIKLETNEILTDSSKPE